MLVLTRKAGEELIIGDNIRVTVTRVSGNRVTLGISAPDDVRIVRGELREIVESFDGPSLHQGAEGSTTHPFAETRQAS